MAHVRRRRAGILALAVTAAILLGIGGSVPSAAAQTLVECTGTESTRFSPGLLLFPQAVSVTINRIYAPCISLTEPSVTSATIVETFPRSLSCLTLLGGGPATWTIRWNTGETSEWQANSTVQIVGGLLVNLFTGAIASGKFSGATAVGTLTSVAPPLLNCLAPPGHTLSQGVLTLTILSTTP